MLPLSPAGAGVCADTRSDSFDNNYLCSSRRRGSSCIFGEEKNKTLFTAPINCARLRFKHCFEGYIVFTRTTGILISLSLEIPCVCCGFFRWTLQTPAALRHLSTSFTHRLHSRRQRRMWKPLRFPIFPPPVCPKRKRPLRLSPLFCFWPPFFFFPRLPFVFQIGLSVDASRG